MHYAFYEFADAAQAEAVTSSDKSKPLVADFDRVWGDRVSRRREVIEVVQELASQPTATSYAGSERRRDR